MVCGVNRTPARGDLLTFNDQAGPVGSTYMLGSNGLSRTGVSATISFETTETVVLNTTATNAETINVTTTVASGTTITNSGGGADVITIAATGANSNVQVNAGTGADQITLSGSGAAGFTLLNGEEGTDAITVTITGANSRTEVQGGANNDTVNLGAPGGAGMISNLQGVICVFGDGNDATLGGALTVCGVARALVLGDTLNFNDEASSGFSTYTLTEDSVVRTGVAATITYETTETVALNASNISDTIIVRNTVAGGTTTINSGGGLANFVPILTTGAGSNVRVNTGVVGSHNVDLNNSGAESFVLLEGGQFTDFLTVAATGTNSRTEVRGGLQNDRINLGGFSFIRTLSNLQGAICVFGEAHLPVLGFGLSACGVFRHLVAGDTLNILDDDGPAGSTYTLTDGSIARTGVIASITYESIETVSLNTSEGFADVINVTDTVAGGTTIIESRGGADVITITTTGSNSNVAVLADEGFLYGAAADVIRLNGSGPNAFTILDGEAGTDTTTVTATALGSRTEIQGGTNNDLINLGAPGGAGTLNNLQGAICVFGEANDGTLGGALTACGVARALVLGDTLNINDHAGPAGSTYTLSQGTVSRTGVSTAITYETTETVVLNTTTANADIINATNTVASGTTTINSGGGADAITIATTGTASNLQVNAGTGDDAITLTNSGVGSAMQLNGQDGFDTISINGTGPSSLTEAHGDNIFVNLGGVQGPLCVFGDLPPVGPPTPVIICGMTVFISGPTVVFDDSSSLVGHDYILTPATLIRDGVVIDTVGFGTVVLTTSNQVDTITVADTGDDTALLINAGDGADVITVQNTGDRSALQVNAGGGNDSIALWRTGVDSATEINGQAGDDTTTMGTPASEPDSLRLDGLLGRICVFGGDAIADADDGTAGVNPTIIVCGAPFALLQRDRLIFNDQNSAPPHTYTLDPTSLTRDGLRSGIELFGVETVELNTTDPLTPPAPSSPADTITVNDTAFVRTTVINAGAGDDVITVAATGVASILQVNAEDGIDAITLQNSGGPSVVELNGGAGDDAINDWATGANSFTELNGGDGDDAFVLGQILGLAGLQGTICVFGNGQDGSAGLNPPLLVCGVNRTLPRGDQVEFTDIAGSASNTYTLADGRVSRTGLAAAITYATVETVLLATTPSADIINVANTVPAGTTMIYSHGSDDTITIASTGTDSNLQVDAGPGADTITLQDSGANSAVELNGQDGCDTIAINSAGTASVTEANGEDFAVELDDLAGTLCLIGEPGPCPPLPPVEICGVMVLPPSPRAVFNDSSGLMIIRDYVLNPTSLSRTGILPIGLIGLGTIVLNTTSFIDRIAVENTISGSATFVNGGGHTDAITIQNTGDDSVLQVNAGAGNDYVEVWQTGNGSLTEINGETGDDTTVLGGTQTYIRRLDGLLGKICVFGGDSLSDSDDGTAGINPSSPVICSVDFDRQFRDRVIFEGRLGAQPHAYTLNPTSLTRDGLPSIRSIDFMGIETVGLNTTDPATPPAAPTPADTVLVTGTLMNTMTSIFTGAGNDQITILSTGAGSVLVAHAGAGDDTIVLQDSGDSASTGVELDGFFGDDTITVLATGAGSFTEAGGGDGTQHNDTINLGDAAITGTLGNLQGTICVRGGAHRLTPTASLEACGMTNALAIGDTLNINDQGTQLGRNYTLSDSGFSRSDLTTVFIYESIETLALNTGINSDTIDVLSTLPTSGSPNSGSTTINSNGGNDAIIIATTGIVSNFVANAGAGTDSITLEGSGAGSFVVLNGDAGTDTITLTGTGSGGVTEVRGGLNNDMIDLGERSPTGALKNLQGTICVFGQGQDGSADLNPPLVVCGVDRTLARGDLLTFNDQGGPGGSAYALTSRNLSRTGFGAAITYTTIETVVLNTSIANADTVTVFSTVGGGTTVVNSAGGDDSIAVGTGDDSNLQVNAGDGADTFTLVNSGVNSAVEFNGEGANDVLNVAVTGSGSLTELNGGVGDDTFTLGLFNTLNALQGTICVFGEGQDGSLGLNPPLVVCGVDRALPRGDLLVLDDTNSGNRRTYTLIDGTLAGSGLNAAITYASAETVVLNTPNAGADINVTSTVARGTTIINSPGANDVFAITTTGAASNLQVGAGIGNDIFNLQNTGAGSATQLNGQEGDDLFNIRGAGAGSETQINAGDDHDQINIGSPAPYPTNSHADQLARNALDETSATDATNNVLGMVCVNGGADCDELFIRGSVLADTIAIGAPSSGAAIEVAQTECISVFTGAGDDTVSNNTFVRSLISGGAGNDMLTGGSSADLIFGGPGLDNVNGRPGDDYLYPDQDSTGALTSVGGETINGGGGTDNAVSAGVGDVVINVTGMVVEEAAINDVPTLLHAQFMAFTPGNIQALFLKGIVTRCECGAGSAAATVGLYDPATGTFFLREQNAPGPADETFAFGAGGVGYIALAGDWDGDGHDTPGLYNPATGGFFLRNTNSGGVAEWAFAFGPGGPGWQPIAGDWDGDGIDTVGLYNVVSSAFFLRNTHAAGVADVVYSFGPAGSGWTPLASDWNGDLTDTVGLYNPATGGFFLRNIHAPGIADQAYTFGPGGLGWKPIAGDWNSDGIDTVGVQDPATSTFFLRNVHAAGPADVAFAYGPPGAGWMPLAGDWNGSEGLPLRLAAAPAASSHASLLDPADAVAAADAAMIRWAVAGLSEASLDRLAATDVQVTDLPGDHLGMAMHGTIYIDRDAAGRGWFVDPTPADDEEFTPVAGELRAHAGPANDRADLLSVLIHELGHELRLDHVDSDTSAADVMAETLALGTRRLPRPHVVDRIFGAGYDLSLSDS